MINGILGQNGSSIKQNVGYEWKYYLKYPFLFFILKIRFV